MSRRPDGRLTHELFAEEHMPQDECGVFGVWAPGEEVAKLTFYGLYALQHRGQESAGMAVSDGESITALKDMGLVASVFDERKLSGLSGYLAIGHTRYSTHGKSDWMNAQPVYVCDAVRTPIGRFGGARADRGARRRQRHGSLNNGTEGPGPPAK